MFQLSLIIIKFNQNNWSHDFTITLKHVLHNVFFFDWKKFFVFSYVLLQYNTEHLVCEVREEQVCCAPAPMSHIHKSLGIMGKG